MKQGPTEREVPMQWIDNEAYRLILTTMPIHCVDIAIYNHANEVLMVKRRAEPAKNRWWLPGGRVIKGEQRRDAARRKVQEECGITVEFLVELFTSETIFDDGPHGIPVHSVNTVYFTMIQERSIVLDDTSAGYKFLRPVDWLSGDLHPYVEQAVRESSRLLL